MDKEGERMIEKKGILFCILISLVLLTNGCQTTKGIAQGMGYTVEGTKGMVEGMARDTTNLWQMILKADNWIKKNLW